MEAVTSMIQRFLILCYDWSPLPIVIVDHGCEVQLHVTDVKRAILIVIMLPSSMTAFSGYDLYGCAF